MTYADVIQKLVTNLAGNFSKVFHSAELITIIDQGKIVDKYPAINVDKEWLELAPTDMNDMIYIRRNGDDSLFKELQIGSCTKAYKMRTPLRIVYFNMNGNAEKSLFYMMQAVLTQSTTPVFIIRDKFKLFREESMGDYNFSPTTVYLAIDVNVFWDLLSDKCDQDFCVKLDNPVQKCEPILETS